MGVSFDVITKETFIKRLEKTKNGENAVSDKIATDIPNGTLYQVGSGPAKQPPYMFGTTQVDFWLNESSTTEYFIVPSVKNRKQAGTYFVHVRNLRKMRPSYNFTLLDFF